MNKFIFIFITLCSVSFASVGAFNIYFDKVLFNHYLDKKIEIITENRRVSTPVLIKHFKPKCIITGTSRIGRGIAKDNEFIKNNQCFNLYLNAANIDELNLLLQKTIKNDVDTIILGLDFFSFNSNFSIKRYQGNFNKYDYIHDSLFISIISNFEKIISLRNLKNNLITLYNNKNFKFEKMQTYEKIYQDTYDVTINKREDIALIDDRYSKSKSVIEYINKNQKGHGIGNFKLNKKGVNKLISIINNINKSDIKVFIFVSPVHLYTLEAIYKAGLKNDYYNIIKKISQTTNGVNTKFYDFSGYNSVTSGLSKDNNYVSGYYLDADHYSSDIGNLIINNLINKKNNFGNLVTQDNFSTYFESKEKERIYWLEKNQLDKKILEEIFKCKKINCIEDVILNNFSLENNDINTEYSLIFDDEIYIPGGTYNYGYDPILKTKFDDEMIRIHLDPFFIDKKEVSYSEYNSTKYLNTKFADLPIVDITYYDAEKYCHSKGKDLPNKFQWEIAAKGGENIRYSWGNKFPNCNLASFNGEFSYGCAGNKAPNIDETFSKSVNSNELGGSKNGAINLSGNVYEFVKSDNMNDALAKGGGWSSEFIRLNIAHNYLVSKNVKYKHIGFRCVKNIER